MATIDERLKAVEGTQRAHEVMIDGIRENVALLREDMNRQFSAVREDMNRQFSAVREDMYRQFSAVREDMNRQLSDFREDTNLRFDAADRRSELLDARVSRQFVWLVGIQVMTLAAVVTSLAAILSAIAGL